MAVLSRQLSSCTVFMILSFRDDLKFSDRQIWANEADPDQTAPRGYWTKLGISNGHFVCNRKPTISSLNGVVLLYSNASKRCKQNDKQCSP